MHITIEQKTLKDALKKIQDCVKKDRNLALTSHVSITTGVDSVTFSATNLDVYLDMQCKAVVATHGSCVVDREALKVLTKQATKETITIFTERNNEIGFRKGTLNTTLDAHDPLPVAPAEGALPFSSINAKNLAEMIKNTSYAVSTDEDRADVMCVYLESQNQGMSMVATDGHRLSFMRLEDKIDSFSSILISKKSTDALYKLLKKCPQNLVMMGASDETLVIKSDTEIMSIRIQGDIFPDYKKIIPKNNDIRIEVNAATLKEAILSCPFSKKNYILGLEITKDKITITGTNTPLDIATLNPISEDISINLNYKYLLDVLATIDGTMVELAFLDSASSVLITEPGNYCKLALIMPIQT